MSGCPPVNSTYYNSAGPFMWQMNILPCCQQAFKWILPAISFELAVTSWNQTEEANTMRHSVLEHWNPDQRLLVFKSLCRPTLKLALHRVRGPTWSDFLLQPLVEVLLSDAPEVDVALPDSTPLSVRATWARLPILNNTNNILSSLADIIIQCRNCWKAQTQLTGSSFPESCGTPPGSRLCKRMRIRGWKYTKIIEEAKIGVRGSENKWIIFWGLM